MSDWISVKAGIPESTQLVLIYAPNEKYLKIRIGLFDPEINIFLDLEITHWMPLPNPPEDK